MDFHIQITNGWTNWIHPMAIRVVFGAAATAMAVNTNHNQNNVIYLKTNIKIAHVLCFCLLWLSALVYACDNGPNIKMKVIRHKALLGCIHNMTSVFWILESNITQPRSNIVHSVSFMFHVAYATFRLEWSSVCNAFYTIICIWFTNDNFLSIWLMAAAYLNDSWLLTTKYEILYICTNARNIIANWNRNKLRRMDVVFRSFVSIFRFTLNPFIDWFSLVASNHIHWILLLLLLTWMFNIHMRKWCVFNSSKTLPNTKFSIIKSKCSRNVGIQKRYEIEKEKQFDIFALKLKSISVWYMKLISGCDTSFVCYTYGFLHFHFAFA